MIILLHGNGDSPGYNFPFPRIAHRFNRAVFNVAMIALPYHFQRCPQQLEAVNNINCLQIAERAAQAITEIRALTGWLLGQGCPTVAFWGVSMGAWYAGMAVCRDARLTSVVLTVPGVRLNPFLELRAINPRIRRNLPKVRKLCDALNLTVLNLTVTRPVIPRDNILLIEGIYDLFAPKEDIEDLWQKWEQPEIWRLRHGHVSCWMSMSSSTNRVLRWLSPRLDKTSPQPNAA